MPTSDVQQAAERILARLYPTSSIRPAVADILIVARFALEAAERERLMVDENERMRRVLRDIASTHLPTCATQQRRRYYGVCDCSADKARTALAAQRTADEEPAP